jgi:hypothetical protein
MTYRQWTRVGNSGAVAIAAAVAAAVLQLPGAAVVAPWLFVGGCGAAIASMFGRRAARRREEAEAEQRAAAELDRLGD